MVSDSDILRVAGAAFQRLKHDSSCRKRFAFGLGTRNNHLTQFRTYIAFCVHFGLDYVNPTPLTLCMYIELLARSFRSAKAVKNYISGVDRLHRILEQPTPASHYDVKLMLRAVENTIGDNSQVKLPLPVPLLLEICGKCDELGDLGVVCKCVFLFAFFGFLRASNLLATSAKNFDIRSQICRGDVLVRPPGLVLIVKWSKTRQAPGFQQLLPLAAVPGHPLCPVRAYHAVLQVTRGRHAHDPLFAMHGSRKALSCRLVRQVLAAILASLGAPAGCYSLHSLRKAGATFCYNSGIALDRIKTHGDWRSDAVWHYITPDMTAAGSVAAKMAAALLHLGY